ncbi:hypothetical protein [Corynebacterium glutamicum]|uniref:hypothetical protein n=1 Tax=Corynebacterium glutamicum TaxID=1718 RepID=UPI000ADADEFC|nr:hypothetical protein [Corynebacterium glutamicum]
MANLPQEGFSVVHGILADPRIWGPEIPYVREEAGQVNVEAPDEAGDLAPIDGCSAVDPSHGGRVCHRSQRGQATSCSNRMAEQEVDLLDLKR